MTRRRLLTSLIALVVAGILVQVALWWIRPPVEPRQMVGPPRSGYTLKNFTFHAYDIDGRLSFRIHSPSLERRENDRSLFIDKPHFLLPPEKGAPGAPWRGRSDYGWINADNTKLKLMGKVDMYRAADSGVPSAEIHTSDVTAWPNQHRLATDESARLRQGSSRMSGVGLRANLDSKYLELLHDFHGTFEPSSHD